MVDNLDDALTDGDDDDYRDIFNNDDDDMDPFFSIRDYGLKYDDDDDNDQDDYWNNDDCEEDVY